MPNFTEKAIKSAFMELLEERPLSKIKVKDIVERCGINRNSFYYHFTDMPQLIDSIVEDNILAITRDCSSLSSVGESFDLVLSAVLKSKKVIYHIYNSVSRESFERYFLDVCEKVITAYFDNVYGEKHVNEADRRLIIRHYKCVCFGSVIDWLESGMKYDLSADFERLCELKKGHTDEMVERSL